MSDKISREELDKLISDSAFNRSSYKVDIRLSGLFRGLSMYTHGEDDSFNLEDNPSRFVEAIPPFQRENDKWSEDMQVKFMENVIKGLTTTLMLYEVVPNNGMPLMCSCKILDGLQRLTALYRFTQGAFKAFGYTHDELFMNKTYRLALKTVKIQVYTFSSEIEAVRFYIEMNENITHSVQDIARAKTYLAKLEADELAGK